MEPSVLENWFDHLHSVLETAYLSQVEPWRQSGMSGPYARWETLRKPVAECIPRSGSFLDIGCANGYLLECCLSWCAERAIHIEPFGLDISPALVALARQRLPAYADHFFVANALTWQPPRKFDFVRSELVYVPEEYEREFIRHLLEDIVAPGGELFIANYAEGIPAQEQKVLPGSHPAVDLLAHLEELGLRALRVVDGHDTVKDRRVRVAVLDRSCA